MTPPTPALVVAGAALVQDGRLLAARRSEPAHLAGGWELPGGKTEPGETPAQACVREIREELGCEVRVVAELATEVPVGPGYVLRAFVVELVSGEPVPLEHDAIRWLAADELDAVAWLEADLPFLEELRPRLLHPVHATFHERDDARTVAAQVSGARVLRDRFAGEDDDEDVAWVVEAPPTQRSRLATLAEQHDGWLLTAEPSPPATPAPLPLPGAPQRLKRA